MLHLWPTDPPSLERFQIVLADLREEVSPVPLGPRLVGGVFVCFERWKGGVGTKGDRGWAAAVVLELDGRLVASSAVRGYAGGPYVPGYLAMREGPLLYEAVRFLGVLPDVLFVNATGLDHPRGAGLAVHLGYLLGVPTVGVTRRTLVVPFEEPGLERGQWKTLGGGMAAALRTQRGGHPLIVHPGWRTELEDAITLVLRFASKAITPEPIRRARKLARGLRAWDMGIRQDLPPPVS